jgi:hypothetical protein
MADRKGSLIMGTILGRKVYQPVPGRIMFRCPGCNDNHGIVVDGSRGWTWNSDGDKPTISPSILCTWSEPSDVEGEFDDSSKDVPKVCHSFIRDGQWQFLSDCTHALAGQTVDIPDWPHGPDY